MVQIHNEDCFVTMERMNPHSVDVVLTSPFYNTNKKAGKTRTLKNTNCHVFIDNDGEVIIDLFINADYGYCIPEVVCNLQETIKSEVEEATKFQVKKINVNVANINI